MQCERYFYQLKRMQIIIDNKSSRLEALRAEVEAPKVGNLKPDVVKTSINLRQQEENIIQIAILEKELNELLHRKRALSKKIQKQIDGMENSMYSRILHLRFEKDYILREIAAELHFNESYLRRLYRQALTAFKRQYNI